ncbi:FecCD family ABC transporter permease [Aestuariibacter salexigens]|uniref:FecCD family ABC transporter permease n=1 Tax=Aestuariibacter salexigens TaxID=226010 RepID=UPI0003F5AD28|nr:iron chelate uptake ABC transporter family permease subunit [Aestuariibacter salexigens]
MTTHQAEVKPIRRFPVFFLALVALFLSAAYLLVFPALGRLSDPLEQQLILTFRLPLLITASVVGAALSVGAASLQVLLRNPLADPGIIGLSSGASLVAATVLLSGVLPSVWPLHYFLPLLCFIGALASGTLIYVIAQRLSSSSSAVILAGIAISTIAGAMIGWMYWFSDAQSLRNLTFWLMGSLHQADWSILSVALPILAATLWASCRQGERLNRYYFGAQFAALGGLDVKRFERNQLLCAALLIGLAVSLAGSIAFIGLLVPHFLRLLVGHDNRMVLPLSAIVGALLMVWVAIGTEHWTTTQLPVSMLTATIGGPLFIWALMRSPRMSI